MVPVSNGSIHKEVLPDVNFRKSSPKMLFFSYFNQYLNVLTIFSENPEYEILQKSLGGVALLHAEGQIGLTKPVFNYSLCKLS
jgi:hypothetical protein